MHNNNYYYRTHLVASTEILALPKVSGLGVNYIVY